MDIPILKYILILSLDLKQPSLNKTVYTAVWMHHLGANKTAGEEARRQLHKCHVVSPWERRNKEFLL